MGSSGSGIEGLIDETVDLGERPDSIGVRLQPQIKHAIAAIAEQDWTVLEDYLERGEAQIAQTMLGHRRLISGALA